MKIFYSAPLDHTQYLIDADIKNILISIHNIKDIYSRIKKEEWLIDNTRYLMIDNGAFSAWNSGSKIITVEEYTNFCKKFDAEFRPLFKDIYYIGLDHIPGEKNTKPNKQQIDDACEITMSNYRYMIDNGARNVLPVVHQFESVDWIKKYEQFTDFICLSPANDQSNKSRSKWLSEVYSVINKTTKTHGLAVTGKVLLEKFPWYSGDSISWKKPFLFGQVAYWKFYNFQSHLFNKIDKNNMDIGEFEIFCNNFFDITNNEKAKKHGHISIDNFKLLEQYITQLWEKRGIIWDV